jgi:O-antigen ligase
VRETPAEPAPRLLVFAAIALGLTIPVQLTVPVGDSAVRLNLADPLAGLLALWVLVHLVRNPRHFIGSVSVPVIAALASATLALTISFIIGINASGTVMAWAVVKYVGWFALLAYFLAGIAIAPCRQAREAFVFAFSGCLAALVLLQLVSLVFRLDIFADQVARFYALAGNPNALSLMLLAGFILAVSGLRAPESKRMQVVLSAMATLNLAGIILAGSVAAFLAVPMVVIALAVLGASWRRLAVAVAMAVLLIVPTRMSHEAPVWSQAQVEKKIGALMSEEKQDASVREATVGVRLEGLRRGIAEWRAHPLFGAGLGIHLAKEQKRAEDPVLAQQIHNTPVWLLAETGLFGLLSVAALFLAVLWRLFVDPRAGWAGSPRQTSLTLAVGVFLVAAIVMSLAHEFLYQRIIWVLIALPLMTSPSSPEGRAES